MLRSRVFAFIGVLVLALLSQVVHAASTVISFDDLASGTRLGTQYESQGVIFGASPGSTGGASVNEVLSVKGGAHSGNNGVRLPEACGVEVYRNQLWARFTSLEQAVSVYVYDVQGTATLVTMEAVSVNGSVLTSASVKSGGGWAQLAVSRPQPDIAFVHISGPPSTGCVFLDDLSFGTAAAGTGAGGGAGPDFALYFSGLDVGTQPGQSGSGGVTLNRFGNSNGRIAFSVSGLPPGTTASIAPQVATGSALAANITLTIAAQTNASAAVDVPVTVSAHALDASAGSTSTVRTVVVPVTIAAAYKLIAQGIEVTQSVQNLKLPAKDPNQPSYGTRAQPIPYNGVRLTSGKKTIARVFVAAIGFTGQLNPNVALYGLDANGKPLPGPNPLLPENTPVAADYATPPPSASVPYAQRVDRVGTPAEFTLPDAWTHGTIMLRAIVTPPSQQSFDAPTDAACNTTACVQLEEMTVSGIAFHTTNFITIVPVMANLTGYLPGPPEDVYAPAFNVLPLEMGIWPYLGDIEMIDIYNDSSKNRSQKASAALDRIEDWAEDNGNPQDLVVGITSGIPPDSDIGMENNGQIFSGNPYAVVNQTRSLTSVAHETGHALGRVHASGDCGASDTSNGQYEDWPYDQSVDKGNGGDLDSIGIDVSSQAPHTVKAAPSETAKPVWHDFMSYCAGSFNEGPADVDAPQVWISAKGWGEIATTYLNAQAILRQKSTNLVAVRGYISNGQATITHVGPVHAAIPQRAGDAAAPYHARFLANGKVLRDVPLVTQVRHLDPTPSAPHGGGSVTAFSAIVPAMQADTLEISQAGHTIARRVRPAHAPTLQLAPQRMRPMLGVAGGAKTTPVAWSSHSDTPNAVAYVDVSTDGGSTWRTIYAGPDKGMAAIPSTLFPDSAPGKARVRVRVNDGFNETSTVSGALTTSGAAPFVHIFEPHTRIRVRADAPLYLRGSGYDNAARQIGTTSLVWSVDGRTYAHGTFATALDLAPGTHTIGLAARDARGRLGSASVSVTILPVRPLFTQLSPPAVISTTDRSVTLTAATTIPATLRVGTTSLALTRTPRNVVVPIVPGNGPAMIPLRLQANGGTSTSTLLIRRRPPRLRPLRPS